MTPLASLTTFNYLMYSSRGPTKGINFFISSIYLMTSFSLVRVICPLEYSELRDFNSFSNYSLLGVFPFNLFFNLLSLSSSSFNSFFLALNLFLRTLKSAFNDLDSAILSARLPEAPASLELDYLASYLAFLAAFKVSSMNFFKSLN
jgi:hypothetical protein